MKQLKEYYEENGRGDGLLDFYEDALQNAELKNYRYNTDYRRKEVTQIQGCIMTRIKFLIN